MRGSKGFNGWNSASIGVWVYYDKARPCWHGTLEVILGILWWDFTLMVEWKGKDGMWSFTAM
jgi:hypothetical protein